MTTRLFPLTAALMLPVAGVFAADPAPEPPVPVSIRPAAGAAPAASRDYEQRLYGPAGALVTPQKAQQVVDAFRAVYEKLGAPRILIAVNRDLVDETGGLQLKSRTEQVVAERSESKNDFTPATGATAALAPQTQVNVAIGGGAAGSANGHAAGKGNASTTTEKVVSENRYEAGGSTKSTLADKMTVRDIERLVGRPLRAAGVRLADQKVAAQLIGDQPISHFTAPSNEAARKDREALAKVADVVLEVLVSTRTVPSTAVSGDGAVTVPDIQITAIRLSDAAIIGQAGTADVFGNDRDAARVARTFDIKDITEATALTLMDDIAGSVK